MKILVIGNAIPFPCGLFTFECELIEALQKYGKFDYKFVRWGRIRKRKIMDVKAGMPWDCVKEEDLYELAKQSDFLFFTAIHRVPKSDIRTNNDVERVYSKLISENKWTVVSHGIVDFPKYGKVPDVFKFNIENKNNISFICYIKKDLIEFYRFPLPNFTRDLITNRRVVDNLDKKNKNNFASTSRICGSKGIYKAAQLFVEREEKLYILGIAQGMEGKVITDQIKALQSENILLFEKDKGLYFPKDTEAILEDKIGIIDFFKQSLQNGLQYLDIDAMVNNCLIIGADGLELLKPVNDIVVKISLKDIPENNESIWKNIKEIVDNINMEKMSKHYQYLLDEYCNPQKYVKDLEEQIKNSI